MLRIKSEGNMFTSWKNLSFWWSVSWFWTLLKKLEQRGQADQVTCLFFGYVAVFSRTSAGSNYSNLTPKSLRCQWIKPVINKCVPLVLHTTGGLSLSSSWYHIESARANHNSKITILATLIHDFSICFFWGFLCLEDVGYTFSAFAHGFRIHVSAAPKSWAMRCGTVSFMFLGKKIQSHQSLGLRMIDMTLKQLLNGMNYNFYKTPRTKRLDHEIIPFKTAKDYNCKVFVFHVPSGSSLGRDKLFAPLSQYKHLVFGDWLWNEGDPRPRSDRCWAMNDSKDSTVNHMFLGLFRALSLGGGWRTAWIAHTWKCHAKDLVWRCVLNCLGCPELYIQLIWDMLMHLTVMQQAADV